MGGKVTVTALDTTFNSKQVVRIMAIGITSYGTGSETRDTSTAYVAKGPGPLPIKGVATTNAATKHGGGLVIDGRDHYTLGNPIKNDGVLGIFTTGTFSIGGKASIGGTNTSGVDVAPNGKIDTSIVHTNQTYPGGYPTTPDGVLGGTSNGYPDGTLKSMAQSGQGGSQYKTDPSTLSYPLSGVTYVELSSGSTWGPKLSGSGILVIHNSSVNAILKQPAGTFTGLIITDDLVNLSGLVLLGAIVQLTPTPTSDIFGTSNGSIAFSRQALQKATSLFQNAPGNGSYSNVVGWWE
jgi:hypothetical protein